MDLVMGGNAPIPPVDLLQVSCSWSNRTGLDADLSTLQSTGGQVRRDNDFFFYNQPTSTDGALQLPVNTAGTAPLSMGCRRNWAGSTQR